MDGISRYQMSHHSVPTSGSHRNVSCQLRVRIALRRNSLCY